MSHFTVLVIGDDVDAQLAPFDEELEVPQYISETRAELISRSREQVERLRVGAWAEYQADPAGYTARVRNPAHVKYLASGEFAAQLTWTDEQHYAESIKYDEPHEINEAGDRLSTYNPRSKWDWWVIGGRWDGALTTNSGAAVNVAEVRNLNLGVTRPTFAVVKDGEWYELGTVGWWGMVSDAKDESAWECEWRKLLASLEPSTQVTLVDAHI